MSKISLWDKDNDCNKKVKTLYNIAKNIDLILFNNVVFIEDYLEPEIEREPDDEEDWNEYYQYYIIYPLDGDYLAREFPDYFSLFYAPKCNLWIL